MANFYDILKNVCILAHEEAPSSFMDINDPYPEIKQYIKDTVEEVCSKFSWTFREKIYTLNTVATQRNYDLSSGLVPANILKDGIRINDYYPPLYFIYHNDLDKQVLSSGKPYRYSVYGGKLILDPTPDDIYTLQIKYLTVNYAANSDGTQEKLNLDLETDMAIIPDRYLKTIEWGAYALYRQNFKPDEKFKFASEKFLSYLVDMQKQDGYSNDSGSAIIINPGTDSHSRLISNFFNPLF